MPISPLPGRGAGLIDAGRTSMVVGNQVEYVPPTHDSYHLTVVYSVTTMLVLELVEVVDREEDFEVDIEVEEVVVLDEEDDETETKVVDVTVTTGGVNVTAEVRSTTVVGLSIDWAGCATTAETTFGTLPSQPPRS
jgi:hypothetical protein